MKKHKILVVSDIHLGSEHCNSSKLISVLKNESSETIIINGDLFDSRYIHRLKKDQWKILSVIRKISKHTRIIFIVGNHDYYKSEILSNLLGFEVYDDFREIINGKKFMFIHGHIFDFIITRYKWCSDLIAEGYYQLCKIRWIQNLLNSWIHTKILTKNDIIKNHAVEYAKSKNVDWIVCGHTHFSEIDEKTGYLNSGTFCTNSPTYITINHDGIPKLEIA